MARKSIKEVGSRRAVRAYKENKEEEAQYDMELAKQYLPLLKKIGPIEQLNQFRVRDMLDSKLGPMGVLVLAELALTASSDRVRAGCARDLAHMGGLKPVEKSQSVNVNVMAEAEIDSLLRSTFEELGLKIIKDGKKARIVSEVEDDDNKRIVGNTETGFTEEGETCVEAEEVESDEEGEDDEEKS